MRRHTDLSLDEAADDLDGSEGEVGRQALPQQVVARQVHGEQHQGQDAHVQPERYARHAHHLHEVTVEGKRRVILGYVYCTSPIVKKTRVNADS